MFLSVVLPFSLRFWLLAFCFGCSGMGCITSCGIVNDKLLAIVHSYTSAISVCLNKESDCLFSVNLLEGHTFSFL